jgi:hypothetical protein
MAGDIEWNNGLPRREDFYGYLLINQGTAHQYDPNLPLYFMYNREDRVTRDWLRRYFPGGTEYTAEVEDRPDLSFYYYIAPPGEAWVYALLRGRMGEAACQWVCE